MKTCFTCGKEFDGNKNFCQKSCYYKRKNYRKHSEETKAKIALGNSKPFSEERKKNISKAKTVPLDEKLLHRLEQLWQLRYLSPAVIKKIAGLPPGSRIYESLFKRYCKYKQYRFMPTNWYPEHYSKLIELSAQGIWFKEIAKVLGFGEKQVLHVMEKLGLKINTRDPNAWQCIVSSVEKTVISWIKDHLYEVETQFQMGNFLYDAHVKNSNILIEVNGDYWHCNPKVYVNGAINEMQKSHLRRDFAKKNHAKQQGYYLITVWEKDIKETPEKIKDWILNKIQTNIIKNTNE